MHQAHHLVRCYGVGSDSLLISFIHVLRFLYLLHQAMSQTLIIVLGSSSSKSSSSRPALLRSTLTRPISLLKNVTISECTLTKTISSLENQVFQAFYW